MIALSYTWGRELARLDLINTIGIRGVEVKDERLSPVVPFCKTHGTTRLTEVWLLPETEWFWRIPVLNQATVNSAEELLGFYSGADVKLRHKMFFMRDKLHTAFFPLEDPQELRWNYSIQHPFGHDRPVLSIILGTAQALAQLYARGIRTRQRQW